MADYPVTYRPISATSHGRRAIRDHGIAPFVDASCRREPDFESRFPSITALCRGRLFVPRLRVGDQVVYLTKKGTHLGLKPKHWRLVAVLRVREVITSHAAASEWYSRVGEEVPSNCLVDGNPPASLDHTGGPKPLERYGDLGDPERVIRRWNAGYRARARDCGLFVVTEPVLRDLHSPVPIFESDLHWLFGGHMPSTQNPPRIPPSITLRLIEHARRRAA